MKAKQSIKIMIDLAMTVLFIILMAYHLTGNSLHEWLGTILFLLFIFHHRLNFKWYTTIFKGKYSAFRVFMIILNTLLFVAMIGMMISGVMLSREVFSFLDLRAGMFGRRLHMISTACGYLLMSAHIGLHLGILVGIRKKKIQVKNKWIKSAIKATVAFTMMYGLYAFITRQIINRMFLLMEYAFFDYEESPFFFIGDYFCILVLFAGITFYLSKKLKKGVK